MNVISFSLYGTAEKYWVGMLENIRLAPYIYPDWEVWIYADSLNHHRLERAGYKGKQFSLPDNSKHLGLFWRFCSAFHSEVDRAIIRDADSRLNWREKAAVDEWITSGKPFHIMRDHVDHTLPIMGGMWGYVKSSNAIPNFFENLQAWKDHEMDGDQKFLTQHVWPLVREKCIAHDSFPDRKVERYGAHDIRPFPPHLPTQTNFVGEQCLPSV